MKKTILIILALLMTTALVWAGDIWYCPMHPHYTSDKAGKCPICSMDLVKRQPAKDQGMANQKISGYAPVVMSKEMAVTIGLKEVSVIKKSMMKTIHAPGTLSRTNSLYLSAYAEIFENDITLIHNGQKATVEIPALGQSYEGTVRWLDQVVDPQTRTVKIRIDIEKIKMKLRANMFVNVSLPVQLQEALTIPIDAVLMTGKRSIVFLVKDQGSYLPREIKTGVLADGCVEVKEGLAEGQKIVSGANFLIDSESRLQAALDGLEPAMAGGSHE